MERDALIAHGISRFLKERMVNSSDAFRIYVSKSKESIIIGNPEKGIFKYDDKNISQADVKEIQLPYAMKLLLSEMAAMGIDVRIGTK